MPEASTLDAALERIQADAQTATDLETLRRALRAGQITITNASGPRAVAVGGSADGAVILTGDGNQVVVQGMSAEALRTLLSPQSALDPRERRDRIDAELAQARQRLAELPLQEIPEPAQLPPGSRIVLSGNPAFVGRVADLRELARVLKSRETAAIGQTAVASGMGGIGKTQLASEFVHRYGQFFAGGVYWLSFADPAVIPSEIAICGGRTAMDLPNFDGLALEQQVAVVRGAWESPLPRLLVLDNCEDPRLLTQWRPRAGGCRVLVTARNARWEDPSLGVRQVRLGTLARPESIELLRKFRPDLAAEDSALWAIADELGDLPLALHLAGSYLLEVGISPRDFLEELRATDPLQHAAFTEDDSEAGWWLPTEHERHVGRTFHLSFGQLRAEDPVDTLAIGLLARAACFAPGEPIPRDLLLVTLRSAGQGTDRRAQRALYRLVSLGLLAQEEGGILRLHRLLVAFTRATIANEDAQTAVEEVLVETVSKLNREGFPSALLPLQPHLRYAEGAARARSSRHAASLANELGYYLCASGDLAAARPYYERALAISETVLGPDHPDTARGVNNLGLLLKDLGDLAGARPYLERALAIYEKVLGPDHSYTATSLNNLGVLLRAKGDLAAARPYYERALAIWEKALGPDHPTTATSLSNLGGLLQAQGDLVTARPYLERALAIAEDTLGRDHPDTAQSLNNLGSLLQAQGDLAAARPYLERALAIRAKTLGPDHPDTAQSLNNLGGLLQAQGDLAAARPYYERALAIYEKVLGPDHPDTAASLNNLGFLLQVQGDLAAARPYLERALAIWEKTLGPDHPNTASSLNNLGVLLQDQGDLAGARPYYERALAIRQALGDRYKEGVSFYQLGNLAIQLGQVVEGARLIAVCFLIDQEIGHADSEQALRSLTNITERLGYSQEQLDGLIDEVKEAYRTDRGRGLLRAAFAATDADRGA